MGFGYDWLAVDALVVLVYFAGLDVLFGPARARVRQCSDEAWAAAFRHAARGHPVALLKARLNAGSDSYPIRAAMVWMFSARSRSIFFEDGHQPSPRCSRSRL